MSEDLWIKIGTKGRRVKAQKINCIACGKELLVRLKPKHSGLCRPCNLKKPKIKEGELFLEWKGIRYRAKKIICMGCGKDLLIRLKQKHCGYCKKCWAIKLGSKCQIKEGELFLKHGDSKDRAVLKKCSNCGNERLVRKSQKFKTTLCTHCASSAIFKEIGSKSATWNTTYGRNLYRRIAFKYFEEKCYCCGSLEKIQIHHISCDRNNNDISNLVPLCNSCHKSVHWRIRNGISCEEAIKVIKAKKSPPRC